MKTFIAISGLEGRDELYSLTKKNLADFKKLHGDIQGFWNDHSEAIDWIRKNGKLLGNCIYCAY